MPPAPSPARRSPVRSLRRPALLATEAPRAAAELGAMAASLPLLRTVPRGDGHPVVVLPGFTTSDRSTRPLRWFLRDRGYHVHGWKQGINVGPTARIVKGVADRVSALADLHGTPMSLVGWSLGGIYARQLAAATPDAIRQVITLGSPFQMMGYTGALPVPSTAVYSRSDSICNWRTCGEPVGERSESIEVLGSHSGLGHNPAVLVIVADRLAQPEGTWQPFRRERYRLLSGVVPRQQVRW